MRKVKEGNVIHLIPEEIGTMNLRCSSCGVIKNELDIGVVGDILTCECGSNSFIPQCELEELM